MKLLGAFARLAIDTLIGVGGMGRVFRAIDPETQRVYAVKVHHPAGGHEPRFHREVAVMAKLDHDAIVRCVGSGPTDDGRTYLVLEWLEGPTLAQRLEAGPLSIPELGVLAARLTSALAHAHALGVLHRDLKPENVVLRGGDVGRATLIDFGVAEDEASRRLTDSGAVLGTLAYMAPEQIRGERSAGPATDVYGLGAVLYQCVSGRVPFQAIDQLSLALEILVSSPSPLSDRPEVPPSVAAAVMAMLAKAPGARPRLDDVALVFDSAHERTEPMALPGALGLDERRMLSLLVVFPHDQRHRSVVDAAPIAEIAEAHEGQADRLAGSAWIVTFGTTPDPADQALRAVACALALRERMPELPIAVVTGPGGEGTELRQGALGDRATRLCRAAVHVDGVRVDADTSALVAAHFPSEDDGAGFIVRKETDPGGETLIVSNQPLPLLGRDRELSRLLEAFERVVQRRELDAILLVGDAGIGKSELIRAVLAHRATRNAAVWIARATPGRPSPPLGVVGDLVRHLVGIRDAESLERRRAKLRDRVAGLFPIDRVDSMVELLGAMCGTPSSSESPARLRADPSIVGDAMRIALAELLEACARARPVILIAEQAEWIDKASRRFLAHALSTARSLPVLAIATARPDGIDEAETLLVELAATRIDLGALDGASAADLVDRQLGRRASDRMRAEILRYGAGNPFHLQQLCRAAAERSHRGPGASALALVQRRFDQLDRDDKRILRAGSVLGGDFRAAGVMRLVGDLDHDELAPRLERLVARGFIVRVEAGVLRFSSELIREAIYGTLTTEDRAFGHWLAAQWLAQGGDMNAPTATIHLTAAADATDPELELTERAQICWLTSARQALEVEDASAVLGFVGRAIQYGARGEQLGQLELIAAEALLWMGDYDAAHARATRAMGLFPRGSPSWLLAASHAGPSCFQKGRLDELRAIADDVLSAPHPPPGSDITISLVRIAAPLYLAGELARGDAVAAIGEGDYGEDPLAEAALHGLDAVRARTRGDYVAQLDAQRARILASERAGATRTSAVARCDAGYMLIELGDAERAVDLLFVALRDAQRLGHEQLESAAQINLGLAMLRLRRFREAMEHLVAADTRLARRGLQRLLVAARTYLAEARAGVGDLEGAIVTHQRAIALAAEVAPSLLALAQATLASTLLEADRNVEALAAATAAYETLGQRGVEAREELVRAVYADALQRNGERTLAGEVAGAANRRLTERAGRIRDNGLRTSFLTKVPEHQRIAMLVKHLA